MECGTTFTLRNVDCEEHNTTMRRDLTAHTTYPNITPSYFILTVLLFVDFGASNTFIALFGIP